MLDFKFYLLIVYCSAFSLDTSIYNNLPAPNNSLFERNDPVLIIHKESELKTALKNSPTPWLVLYYAHWCGHCIHYAPEFKNITMNLLPWYNTFRVAVVDCGNPENTNTCKIGDVQGYPTLQIYDAYTEFREDTNLLPALHRVENRNDAPLRVEILETVFTNSSNKFDKLNWQKSWNDRYNQGNPCPLQPNFETFESPAAAKNVSSWGTGQTMFIHTSDKTLANSLVLSINAYWRGLSAFHVNDSTEELVFHDDTATKLSSKLLNLKKGIDKVLKEVSEKYPQISTRSPNFEFAKGNDNFELLENEGLEQSPKEIEAPVQEKEVVVTTTEKPESSEASEVKVPSNDMAQTLARMIEIEIPAKMKDDTKDFAVNILKTAEKYSTYLELDENEIDELKKVDEGLENMNFPKFTDEWLECKCSESKFRGYPCGLWSFFHTILSACASEQENCIEVVRSIKYYVMLFFECTECVKNFENEIKDLKIGTSSKQQVLWLWKLHNSVNARLAGDQTEDPAHPKIQFPSASDCKYCHNGDDWDKNFVYQFLQKHYAGEDIEVKEPVRPEKEEPVEENEEKLEEIEAPVTVDEENEKEEEVIDSPSPEKDTPDWIKKGVEEFEADHDHSEEKDEKVELDPPLDPNTALQKANWENLANKRIEMLKRGDRQHDKHEHISDYTEQLEMLGFDEDEIHEKLRQGDFDSVRNEISHQTKQIEQFLTAFRRIVDEHEHDPAGFEEARDRLFHRIQDDKIVYSIDELERLQHRDPKKLRNLANKWHYKSDSAPSKETQKYIYDKLIQEHTDRVTESHVHLFSIIASIALIYFIFNKLKICKRRKFSHLGIAGGYTFAEKDPEKQF